jgi:hypothetical protein
VKKKVLFIISFLLGCDCTFGEEELFYTVDFILFQVIPWGAYVYGVDKWVDTLSSEERLFYLKWVMKTLNLLLAIIYSP